MCVAFNTRVAGAPPDHVGLPSEEEQVIGQCPSGQRPQYDCSYDPSPGPSVRWRDASSHGGSRVQNTTYGAPSMAPCRLDTRMAGLPVSSSVVLYSAYPRQNTILCNCKYNPYAGILRCERKSQLCCHATELFAYGPQVILLPADGLGQHGNAQNESIGLLAAYSYTTII